MGGCDDVLKSEKELKKEGRGSFRGAVDLNTGITVVRLFDRKMVQLASNYLFSHPTVPICCKSDKSYVEVP